MEWLAASGAQINLPVGHGPDVDLIAEVGARPLRVQVKTSTCRHGRGHRRVMAATRGGNQSWTGLVKYFDRGGCDFLFIHVGDGRRWFIPAEEIESRSGLTLGGAKYCDFEVGRGRALSPGPSLESPRAGGAPEWESRAGL
jgi:hypothetical protein